MNDLGLLVIYGAAFIATVPPSVWAALAVGLVMGGSAAWRLRR